MVKKEETAAYIVIGAFILFGIVLLYDGFGGGSYTEERHRNKMKEDALDKERKSKVKVSFEETAKTFEEKAPETVETQVACNKFKLVTNVTDSTLNLSVDTDLPDNTVVMVSVSRSYLQKGSYDTYSLDYFSEKSTIGKWKLEHRISIDSEKWKTALRTKQENLSRVGLGFDVASISDNITLHMVVPINQPDPRFGERNSNLTGKAVTMASEGGRTIAGKFIGPMYVVEDEITIDYPLN